MTWAVLFLCVNMMDAWERVRGVESGRVYWSVGVKLDVGGVQNVSRETLE